MRTRDSVDGKAWGVLPQISTNSPSDLEFTTREASPFGMLKHEFDRRAYVYSMDADYWFCSGSPRACVDAGA